jgi:hypothetical protein
VHVFVVFLVVIAPGAIDFRQPVIVTEQLPAAALFSKSVTVREKFLTIIPVKRLSTEPGNELLPEFEALCRRARSSVRPLNAQQYRPNFPKSGRLLRLFNAR